MSATRPAAALPLAAETRERERTEAERREILDRWNADYVALSLGEDDERAAWESMVAQPELFEPVVDSYRFGLLRVVR